MSHGAGISNETPSEISGKSDDGDKLEEKRVLDISFITVPGVSSQLKSAYAQDDIDSQNKKDAIGKWVNLEKRKRDETDPYPQNQFLRKFYPFKEKVLPKELRELFTPLQCKLCNCIMSSTITAKDHYEGKKHISNIKKWMLEHQEFPIKYGVLDLNQSKIVVPEKLYCTHCGIMMSSEQQAQSHYLGKRHRSVVHGGVMKDSYYSHQTRHWKKCEPVLDDTLFGIRIPFLNKEGKTRESSSNQKYSCHICQVACASEVNFNKHIAGAKHQKRILIAQSCDPPPVAKDNILEDVIKSEKMTPSSADLSIYRTPSGKYYCCSCNVTVNSPTQFLQHSESRKHKHKFSKQAK